MCCVAGYLQDLVYNLSKVGQAIEKNDLPAAGLVLGNGSDTEWVKTANLAFTKVHIVSSLSLLHKLRLCLMVWLLCVLPMTVECKSRREYRGGNI